MTKFRTAVVALVIGACGVASPVAAHHAWPVSYEKLVTVKGTVTSYNWGNPHTMFGLDVTTANGQVQKWNVGGPSTDRMARNGWGRDTLKPGDTIAATGYQFADGQNILRLEKVMLAGGKELFLYGRR
jgi:hypothetical protein